MKQEILNIRIDSDLKKKLQMMADNDNRTLSDFVRLQLQKLADKTK
jgi:antitoxin component of RelBE/YafQ-DinJ toxin-antitoxin module